MLTKYRTALGVLPVALSLVAAGIANAGPVVIHGKVLSITPQTKVFRMLVQETGKERSIFTTSKTTFKLSDGRSTTFADVKVGKTVEIKGEVKSSDAYTATAVSIRL